ncbi:MAG: ABC transporter ATP-binding protein/permease, partial [archaeon GB-1867-035]|nr:ABC transporter ATP-binding protein/permease [Candidatus Culexmicrobium profundum]
MVAIYVAIDILKFFNNYYWRYIGSEVARDLSVILYNRITRSSLKDYRKISTGEYVSRLAIDCDKFANYALGFSSEVILGIIRLTIQSIVLFLLSPHLLIALLLIVPLYFLFYKRHVNALADTAEMERKVWGDFVNSLTEFLGCILYIRERNAVEFTKRILSKRLKSQLYFRRKVLKTIGVNELIRSILNEITPLTLLTIGRSGVGKTTLALILAGLLKPDTGEVLVNGLEINRYRDSDLRRKIAYVPQNPPLLTMSLRENITFGNRISEEELMKILEVAGISELAILL